MPYIQQIRQFKPLTDSEKSDKQRRSQLAHLTSSGFILNPSMTKTLMVHHNIYQTWAWTGGHADGDRDLLKIAIKEAKEEAGLKRISPLVGDMLSLDILTVKGHYKRGEYVSAHLHLSAAYVLIAEEDEELTVKPDENSDVAWIAVEEMNKMSNEPEMIPVYQKLYERALEIKNKQKSH
ncbi:MAG: hypothetical protein PWQ84_2006 [Thermotogaceae bacterium]|nr:hypothetical protein [Thermotogaceae bacterium]